MEDITKIRETMEAMKQNTQLSTIDDSIEENKIIEDTATRASNVKEVVDIMATKAALTDEEIFTKVVDEKAEELRNDAEARRVEAETQKISKEAERAEAALKKEIAELNKIIEVKKKDVENLKAESDKENTYFESNKDILKYIGIREKKSLKAMRILMIPATVIFVLVQILLSPLTFAGLILETIVNIMGGICGAIKNNALKIVISVGVVIIVVGVGFCAYFFAIRGITQINK